MQQWYPTTPTVVLQTAVLRTAVMLTAFALCVWSSTFPHRLAADPIVCSEDLDGDGDVSGSGETADCALSAAGDTLCPIGAVACETSTQQNCPVVDNLCIDGECSTPGTCEPIDSSDGLLWFCPPLGSGNTFSAAAACDAACANATSACTGGPASYTCPLGSQFACVDVDDPAGSMPQCSPNACLDLGTNPPVESDIPGTMLQDDGERDQNGNCLGTTVVFNGRGMECLPPGIDTAFSNCCDWDEEIYFDSMGSLTESTLQSKAITATFQAMQAAYSAYAAAQASGATAGAAASAASSAATDVFLVAFDPTTLAISVAVALIVDWLTQGCDQESLEAAALKASNYCIELGSYCKKDWPIGGCVQRANVQCCFNSKLARIIHEQGRAQLNTFPDGFGTAEEPDCRGFLPEEFQALDFSKIDLSEYYDDIRMASDEVLQQRLEEGVQRFNETLGLPGS